MSSYFHFQNFYPSIKLAYVSLAAFTLSCNRPEPIADNEIPEENRFTKVVLTEGFDEPMAMTFLDDGRVLVVERKGGLKSVDTKTNQVKLISTIPVNTKYTTKEGVVSEAEEGLMGVVTHPKFAGNHWIYMYYADPSDTKHVLARWELRGDSLMASTKKILMEVPTQREECCHTGGGMAFDIQGNLYLTVGNNTSNPASGTSSYDERPGRSSWDDQRSSGNANDLRGKILRIRPEDDGTYSIPEGNLFAKGTEKTRPEIFVMGNRNPWRVSVDSKTGYVYWGEVGPDASADSVWGPRGYDEFNQARKAGNFGWPYFIGDNKPYTKYNYADSTYGETFNAEHPTNNSPNNTGLKELPVPQKAFIWYPYGTSDSFPLLGSSGRSAVGGPVFHKNDFKNAKRIWPSYYEDKWLITDFMRGWLMAVTMDKEGNYRSMERVLPGQNFSSVIDMQFSPEGDLYFLEYGSAWFRGNANSALVRIEYNAGNRKPEVVATADRMAGAVPFKVNLSSKGTVDHDKHDKDGLKYEWKITSSNGYNKIVADKNPVVTFDQPGIYQAALTVTDSKGAKNSKSLELKAGNEPPVVAVNITKGNKTFFFPGQTIEYSIAVSDKEDGSAADGKIKAEQVAVNFDYVPEGFDPINIAQNHRAADERTGFVAGLYLIKASDCNSCHILDKTSVGPSFTAISEKYKTDPGAVSRLADKVINGGSGVWGEHAMAAHPKITKPEAETIVKYILGVTQKKGSAAPAPLSSSYVTKVPPGENGKGGYLLRAAYTDKGAGTISSLSSENILALRNPAFDPQKADKSKSTQLLTTPSVSFTMLGNNSYIGYDNIDLTGIKGINFLVQATPQSGDVGGIIEIHLDSPDGKLVGQTAMIDSKPVDYVRLMENAGTSSKNSKTKSKKDKGPAEPAGFDFSKLIELMSTQVGAPINAVDGVHNIYFVFKNSKAGLDEPLMQVVEIRFLNIPRVIVKN
ncbi:MAG: PQQ-dependent sugar dehydrogenase [Chitinophagaceae bacterium]